VVTQIAEGGKCQLLAQSAGSRLAAFDDKAEVGVFGLTARKESLKIYKIAACQVTHECRQSVASVAGVALSHGINANIVHRWLRKPTQCALVQAPAGK